MYESPLNLIYQDIERQIVQKQESMILEAIRNCDVVVDKEELIKAINYDRNQYSKGYKDGVNNVLDKIREEIEEIPKKYLMTMDYESGLKEALAIIDKYKAESKENKE